jgi:chemotaxis protein CheD
MNVVMGDAPGSRVNLIQGECRVSADPSLVMATVLGSCVAACLHDSSAHVGGMNHFLLPEGDKNDPASLRYGAYAMELLVNGLLTLGAKRETLRAKLFGGSRLNSGLADIGQANIAFARNYLRREGIRYSGGSTGGIHARKVQFWPVSGRARQALLPRATELEPLAGPINYGGDLELF